MSAYEYDSVLVPASKQGVDLAVVTDLGRNGWEAFSAVPAAFDGHAYAELDGLLVLLRRQLAECTQMGLFLRRSYLLRVGTTEQGDVAVGWLQPNA